MGDFNCAPTNKDRIPAQSLPDPSFKELNILSNSLKLVDAYSGQDPEMTYKRTNKTTGLTSFSRIDQIFLSKSWYNNIKTLSTTFVPGQSDHAFINTTIAAKDKISNNQIFRFTEKDFPILSKNIFEVLQNHTILSEELPFSENTLDETASNPTQEWLIQTQKTKEEVIKQRKRNSESIFKTQIHKANLIIKQIKDNPYDEKLQDQ